MIVQKAVNKLKDELDKMHVPSSTPASTQEDAPYAKKLLQTVLEVVGVVEQYINAYNRSQLLALLKLKNSKDTEPGVNIFDKMSILDEPTVDAQTFKILGAIQTCLDSVLTEPEDSILVRLKTIDSEYYKKIGLCKATVDNNIEAITLPDETPHALAYWQEQVKLFESFERADIKGEWLTLKLKALKGKVTELETKCVGYKQSLQARLTSSSSLPPLPKTVSQSDKGELSYQYQASNDEDPIKKANAHIDALKPVEKEIASYLSALKKQHKTLQAQINQVEKEPLPEGVVANDKAFSDAREAADTALKGTESQLTVTIKQAELVLAKCQNEQAHWGKQLLLASTKERQVKLDELRGVVSRESQALRQLELGLMKKKGETATLLQKERQQKDDLAETIRKTAREKMIKFDDTDSKFLQNLFKEDNKSRQISLAEHESEYCLSNVQNKACQELFKRLKQDFAADDEFINVIDEAISYTENENLAHINYFNYFTPTMLKVFDLHLNKKIIPKLAQYRKNLFEITDDKQEFKSSDLKNAFFDSQLTTQYASCEENILSLEQDVKKLEYRQALQGLAYELAQIESWSLELDYKLYDKPESVESLLANSDAISSLSEDELVQKLADIATWRDGRTSFRSKSCKELFNSLDDHLLAERSALERQSKVISKRKQSLSPVPDELLQFEQALQEKSGALEKNGANQKKQYNAIGALQTNLQKTLNAKLAERASELQAEVLPNLEREIKTVQQALQNLKDNFRLQQDSLFDEEKLQSNLHDFQIYLDLVKSYCNVYKDRISKAKALLAEAKLDSQSFKHLQSVIDTISEYQSLYQQYQGWDEQISSVLQQFNQKKKELQGTYQTVHGYTDVPQSPISPDKPKQGKHIALLVAGILLSPLLIGIPLALYAAISINKEMKEYQQKESEYQQKESEYQKKYGEYLFHQGNKLGFDKELFEHKKSFYQQFELIITEIGKELPQEQTPAQRLKEGVAAAAEASQSGDTCRRRNSFFVDAPLSASDTGHAQPGIKQSRPRSLSVNGVF